MKLCAAISVFNGLELLDACIENIRPHVDQIVLCVSTANHFGILDDSAEHFVCKYQHDDLISVHYFTPNPQKNSKANERDKHQLMIEKCRSLSMTHVLFLAEDHFYESRQIEYGKRFVDELDLDATFTWMFTYYKHPTWQLTPIENYCFPFIFKLNPKTCIQYQRHYPVKTDPSVQINTTQNWKLFEPDTLIMHHMSMVRLNIREKFESAAAKIRWKPGSIERFIGEYESYDINENPGISYFQMRTIRIVSDPFNIRLDASIPHS